MKRVEKSIVDKIKRSEFVLTVHARERMNERHISELDIIEVAKTLESIVFQERHQTYLLSGLSTWGEPLFIAVAIRGEVIVVTIFFEEDEYENYNDE